MTTTIKLVNIEISFIYHTLTKIGESGEKTNDSSIKILQEELVFNAVSIQFTIGDGINGHLFLVLSATEYTAATISTTHPIIRVPVPVAPIMPVQSLSLVQRSITAPTTNVRYEVTVEFRNNETTKIDYFLYYNTSKALVNKLSLLYHNYILMS